MIYLASPCPPDSAALTSCALSLPFSRIKSSSSKGTRQSSFLFAIYSACGLFRKLVDHPVPFCPSPTVFCWSYSGRTCLFLYVALITVPSEKWFLDPSPTNSLVSESVTRLRNQQKMLKTPLLEESSANWAHSILIATSSVDFADKKQHVLWHLPVLELFCFCCIVIFQKAARDHLVQGFQRLF